VIRTELRGDLEEQYISKYFVNALDHKAFIPNDAKIRIKLDTINSQGFYKPILNYS
jgi:hypothetical protein